jgi:hypothetical protein
MTPPVEEGLESASKCFAALDGQPSWMYRNILYRLQRRLGMRGAMLGTNGVGSVHWATHASSLGS